jgi:hypothetical protein
MPDSSTIRETGKGVHVFAMSQKPNCRLAIAPMDNAVATPAPATNILKNVTSRRVNIWLFPPAKARRHQSHAQQLSLILPKLRIWQCLA